MKKSNIAALLPILVFLILYLGTGVLFEYVLKIPMGFYNIPIVVPFMIAIFVACMQNRKASFDEKLQIMANGMADKNIITMLLIFLTAGVFVGVVGALRILCCRLFPENMLSQYYLQLHALYQRLWELQLVRLHL